MITFSQSARRERPDGAPTTLTTDQLRAVSSRATAAMQSISVGTAPLKASRDFRLLWLAALPGGIAMGAVGLAVFVQAYELTGSPAAVGAFGLVQFAAMFVGVVGGSAIVDHVDRKRLLLITQTGFGVSACALLAGSLVGDPPLALLYLASAIGSALASLHFPTRSAMITPVVEPAVLTTALTLEVVVWNATMIAGPLIGGAVLAGFGLSGVYALSVGCHAVSALTMLRLQSQAPRNEGDLGRMGTAAVRRGLAYLRPRPVLRAILWTDLIVMAFAMRRSLFPVLAVERFHAGPAVVGLLMAAIPAGALIISLTGNWIVRVRRQGLGLVAAGAVWGVAIAAFGLSGDRLWLAVLFLAVAGGAHIVAAILRGTIIHQQVPTDVRGRVWGINFLVVNGGPRLGDLSGGLAASAWGATTSAVGGGVAALAGVLLYTALAPALLRYRSREEVG